MIPMSHADISTLGFTIVGAMVIRVLNEPLLEQGSVHALCDQYYQICCCCCLYDGLIDDDVMDLIVGSDPMCYECLTPRTHRLCYCCLC